MQARIQQMGESSFISDWREVLEKERDVSVGKVHRLRRAKLQALAQGKGPRCRFDEGRRTEAMLGRQGARQENWETDGISSLIEAFLTLLNLNAFGAQTFF